MYVRKREELLSVYPRVSPLGLNNTAVVTGVHAPTHIAIPVTQASYNSYTHFKFISVAIVKLTRDNEVVEYPSGLKL